MTKKERKPSVSSGTAGQVADLSWACRCQTWREGSDDVITTLRGQSLMGGTQLSLILYRGSRLCTENGYECWRWQARGHQCKKVTPTNLTEANVKKKGISVF